MSQDLVQEIKARTDLVELISQYVSLRRAGRTYKGLCPFHQERTPSFTVDPERGFFKCYGCGAGGDCFSFLEKQLGLDFSGAGEVLARRLNMAWLRPGERTQTRSEREQLYDVLALADRFFQESLRESQFAHRYLLDRGLDDDTLREFGIGYAPPGYEALLARLKKEGITREVAEKADLVLPTERGWRDRFVDRITFPIGDVEGRTIAFGGRALRADGGPKYLNTRETAIFQKGRTLYGMHLARKPIAESGAAIAVEGYMDLIALHQAGILNVIATLGTALTDSHVAMLRRYTRDQEEARLLMCYDGDSAGLRAAERNSLMFERAGLQVRIVELPAGEDPDTFVRSQGPDAFRARLELARPLIQFQLDRLREGRSFSTEEDRVQFVREATRVISRSASDLTRRDYQTRLERIIEQLAAEWYPGDPHRVMHARAALIREVEKGLNREAGAPAARTPSPPGAARPQPIPRPQTQAGPRAGGPSARTRAEHLLVRAALTEGHWAARIKVALTAAHFQDPALHALAERLLGGDTPAPQQAAALRGDPDSAEQISTLVMDASPIDDAGVDACIAVLQQQAMVDRLRALQQANLTEGGFKPQDPRAGELRALLEELGSGHRREN